jgi:hypothetical protein
MKLVKESLGQTFTRGTDDKLSSIGIGKRGMIKNWLDKYGILNYTINEDDSIDVSGNVRLIDLGLNEFPDYIQFGDVIGSFWMYRNNFTSLKGCPTYVVDNFDCEENNLKNLKYAPKRVDGNFYCRENYLEHPDSIVKRFDKRVKGAVLVYPQNKKP